MDPVTAIGLLASIATLLKASKGAVDLVKSFKDARKDLGNLITDLVSFEEALQGFDRVFRSRQTKHNISAEVLRRAVNDGNATIAELQSRVVQVYRTEPSAFRRLKYVQNKSAFETLSKRIQSQCQQMHGFMSLVHVETFLAACNQNPQLLEACAAVVDEEMQSDSASLAKYISQSSTASELSSSGGTLIESLVSSSSSTLSTSNALTLAGHERRRSSQSRSDEAPTIVQQQQDSVIIRRACRHDCYCRCHEQSSTPEPSGKYSRFNARVFREGARPKVECSDPTCAAVVSLKTTVPLSAFKRAIGRLISSNNIVIGYRLNTYRPVPEGSDAMRYVKHGNLDKLKLAIQSNEATPWDTAPDGWSLLHTAAYARQLPTVRYLVQLGAETEVSDLGTRKPVDLAFLKSRGADATQVEKDIVQVFSSNDDFIDDYEFTPIHIAVLDLYDPSDHERPTLEELIDFMDQANSSPRDTNWAQWKAEYKDRSPLFSSIIELFRLSAAENNDPTKVIIHNQADQKDRKFHWTPLHWASATGQVNKMKTLVSNGADPFIRSNLNANILHAAVESNALETLAYGIEICKRYPDQISINQVNVWGETPLIMAAQGCLVGCVKLLLDAGADRNIRQENQQVALHYAGLSDKRERRRETVVLLCERRGAGDQQDPMLEIDAQDEEGRPPIFDFLDDLECLNVLIKNGASLALVDIHGHSILHHACIQGETRSLRGLLQILTTSTPTLTSTSNPPPIPKDILKVKNHAGNTPLIEALRHESIDCAMLLLRHEVGDMVGQDGWAAIHYAAKIGNPELLKAVLQHPGFVRGLKTDNGQTARVVAMESGNWKGVAKELLNRYNSVL